MAEFKIEDEHEHITFMFDSSDKVSAFAKEYPDMKFTVVSGKEENRLRGKADAFESMLKSNHLNCINAVKGLIPYRSLLEMAAEELGAKPKSALAGLMLCKTCINRAITSCEEVLEILKDVREDVSK